ASTVFTRYIDTFPDKSAPSVKYPANFFASTGVRVYPPAVHHSACADDDPRAILAARLHHRDALTDRFVDHLRDGHGGEIRAIIFYGSLLSNLTSTPSSFHDFYVIVDSLSAYHARLRDRVVGLVLPPSVYYSVFPDGLRCKYCVLTSAQLTHEM